MVIESRSIFAIGERHEGTRLTAITKMCGDIFPWPKLKVRSTHRDLSAIAAENDIIVDFSSCSSDVMKSDRSESCAAETGTHA